MIFIKHNFSALWKIIDWFNGMLFKLFYHSKLERVLQRVMDDASTERFIYRELQPSDIPSLKELIDTQSPEDLNFFSPHGFNMKALNAQIDKPAFLMMGAFDEQQIIGYFFLRFFANKKCFVGRLIDRELRGKGIGTIMNRIMYETAWEMGFRCLSTISRNNTAVMRAHAKNPTMLILKELQNDYLLVEFIRK